MEAADDEADGLHQVGQMPAGFEEKFWAASQEKMVNADGSQKHLIIWTEEVYDKITTCLAGWKDVPKTDRKDLFLECFGLSNISKGYRLAKTHTVVEVGGTLQLLELPGATKDPKDGEPGDDSPEGSMWELSKRVLHMGNVVETLWRVHIEGVLQTQTRHV